jgi:hypothetical protein
MDTRAAVFSTVVITFVSVGVIYDPEALDLELEEKESVTLTYGHLLGGLDRRQEDDNGRPAR